jgi:hypothetical protein
MRTKPRSRKREGIGHIPTAIIESVTQEWEKTDCMEIKVCWKCIWVLSVASGVKTCAIGTKNFGLFTHAL